MVKGKVSVSTWQRRDGKLGGKGKSYGESAGTAEVPRRGMTHGGESTCKGMTSDGFPKLRTALTL